MNNTVMVDDYLKYRGKCKEMSESLIREDPTLRLVRGYYYCPMWGRQEHWWCETEDGDIIDPTVKQFPTNGHAATYEEWDGTYECAECGKVMSGEPPVAEGNYACCSTTCMMKLVGLGDYI